MINSVIFINQEILLLKFQNNLKIIKDLLLPHLKILNCLKTVTKQLMITQKVLTVKNYFQELMKNKLIIIYITIKYKILVNAQTINLFPSTIVIILIKLATISKNLLTSKIAILLQSSNSNRNQIQKKMSNLKKRTKKLKKLKLIWSIY